MNIGEQYPKLRPVLSSHIDWILIISKTETIRMFPREGLTYLFLKKIKSALWPSIERIMKL